MIADVITVIIFIIITYDDALQQLNDVTSYGHPA